MIEAGKDFDLAEEARGNFFVPFQVRQQDLHRFNDADHGIGIDPVAHLDEGRRVGVWRGVKRADHG